IAARSRPPSSRTKSKSSYERIRASRVRKLHSLSIRCVLRPRFVRSKRSRRWQPQNKSKPRVTTSKKPPLPQRKRERLNTCPRKHGQPSGSKARRRRRGVEPSVQAHSKREEKK